MMIQVKELSFSYGEADILTDINLNVTPGTFTAIIGPNGAGKTTLFRLLTKSLSPHQGKVTLDNQDLAMISFKNFSKKAAVISQGRQIRFPFTCLEIVMMGRSPYRRRTGRVSKADLDVVRSCMEWTDTHRLKDALVTEISGGEKQRVMLAKALAQKPKVLFLDEAFSNMDIEYRIRFLSRLKKLAAEEGMTIVAVMHDLHMVNLFSDEVIVLKAGQLVEKDRPEGIFTPKKMQAVFGIDAKRISSGELVITAS
jgi:iron complex transport system ATP-binding protein